MIEAISPQLSIKTNLLLINTSKYLFYTCQVLESLTLKTTLFSKNYKMLLRNNQQIIKIYWPETDMLICLATLLNLINDVSGFLYTPCISDC